MNKRRRRRRIWRTRKYKSESSRRKGTNFRDVCLLNINSLLHNCSLYEHVGLIFSLIRVVTGHRRPHSRSKVFITQHSMTHIIYKGCTRLKRYASPTEINCYGKQNTENECYCLFVCLVCEILVCTLNQNYKHHERREFWDYVSQHAEGTCKGKQHSK
jgi:hypothetical protein